MQSDAQLLLNPVIAAMYRPENSGHQMEGIAAAKHQRQGAIKQKQGASPGEQEKQDRGNQIEQQVTCVKDRLHNIRNFCLVLIRVHFLSSLSKCACAFS